MVLGPIGAVNCKYENKSLMADQISTCLVSKSKLYEPLAKSSNQVVYSDAYNIRLFGLERLHPFDSQKWGNIHKFLRG